MPYYRLYFLNGSHIERARQIEAPDDADAIRQAKAHEGSHSLELWCGRRQGELSGGRASKAQQQAAE